MRNFTTGTVLSLLLLAGVAAPACGGTTVEASRTVRRYGACSADSQCERGMNCLCGICAVQCDVEKGCTEKDQVCVGAPANGCTVDVSPSMCADRCSAPEYRCPDDLVCQGRPVAPDGVCMPGRCNTNYRRFSSSVSPPVSLRGDVMPIFGFNCVMSECHNEREPAARLYLGPKCQYDPNGPRCVFPDSPDPDSTLYNPPAPLTEESVLQVRALLLGPSATAPEVALVAPGEPEKSFLLDAMAGTASNRGYHCTKQLSPHENLPKPCGDTMFPFWALSYSVPCGMAGGPEHFDTIARWIAEGAADN